MNIKTADIGTVSHAKLRPQDLAEAFGNELEAQIMRQTRDGSNRVILDYCTETLWDAREEFYNEAGEFVESEHTHEYIHSLIEALDVFAPAHCYFGAIEGDNSELSPSIFGYWPCWDSLDELPKVGELPDGPIDDETECVQVSDHGNATLYAWDGAKWTEVWGLV